MSISLETNPFEGSDDQSPSTYKNLGHEDVVNSQDRVLSGELDRDIDCRCGIGSTNSDEHGTLKDVCNATYSSDN